jgi:dienelactone hydrolase
LTHFASHGFVVAAPKHRDCEFGCDASGNLLEGRELAVLRPDDIRSVIDDVLRISTSRSEPALTVDPRRIGLAGFSFGGYTVLKEIETDPRALAALLLAPATVLPVGSLDASKVARPLMFMQGEWDSNILIARTWTFFQSIPLAAPERWFIDVHSSGHFFATNFCLPGRGGVPSCESVLPQAQAATIIKRWATPFLLVYVAQDVRYLSLLAPSPEANPKATVIDSRNGSSPIHLPTAIPLP